MSKQKNTDLPETENEVTENLVEQSELEGISSNNMEEVVESTPEIEKPVKVAKINKFLFIIISLYGQLKPKSHQLPLC